jgi:hypothetical protein
VSVAGITDARTEPVVTTRTPVPPSSQPDTGTANGTADGRTTTDAWPTLVGSGRGPDADTVPGFGAAAAVAALAAAAAALVARTR